MIFLTHMGTWKKSRAKSNIWWGTEPYAFFRYRQTTCRSLLSLFADWTWSHIRVRFLSTLQSLGHLPFDNLCRCNYFWGGTWSSAWQSLKRKHSTFRSEMLRNWLIVDDSLSLGIRMATPLCQSIGMHCWFQITPIGLHRCFGGTFYIFIFILLYMGCHLNVLS